MDFPAKLQFLMRSRGLGNRALAEAIGTTHPPVGEWLKGTARPRAEVAKRLADYFGVTVEDLFDDARELPPDRTKERYREAHEAAARIEEAGPIAQRSVFISHIQASAHADLLRHHARRLKSQAEEMENLAAQMDPTADPDANPIVQAALEEGRALAAKNLREKGGVAQPKPPKAAS